MFYSRDFCVYMVVEVVYHRRNVLCLYRRGKSCITGETFVYRIGENHVL